MSYQKGTAFTELLKHKDELSRKNGFELAVDFSENKEEIRKFSNYKYYHIWAAFLLKHGAKIKTKLDEIQIEVNDLNDTFCNSIQKIDGKHSKLIIFQKYIRNFEHDSYDFINTYSATEVNQKSSEILTILNILEEINRTYDRIYNQTRQKISNISNARVSYSSLCLSVVAIGIALLSLTAK